MRNPLPFELFVGQGHPEDLPPAPPNFVIAVALGYLPDVRDKSLLLRHHDLQTQDSGAELDRTQKLAPWGQSFIVLEEATQASKRRYQAIVMTMNHNNNKHGKMYLRVE